MRPHLVEQVKTFAPGCRVARVVEVHQQEVVRLPRHAIDDVVDRAHKVGLEARIAEKQAQRLQDVGLVVGDKDARKGHAPDVFMLQSPCQNPGEAQRCQCPMPSAAFLTIEELLARLFLLSAATMSLTPGTGDNSRIRDRAVADFGFPMTNHQ